MNQTALALAQHVEQIVRIETVTGDAHRKASDELRLQPVGDEVGGGELRQQFVRVEAGFEFRVSGFFRNPDFGFRICRRQPAPDDFGDAGECPAHDEENVPRVDRFRLGRSAAAHRGHRALQLARHVVRRHHRHVAVLHQLEEIRLHAASGDIAPRARLARRQLVHLVEIDDAVLRALHIAARAPDEIAHEIIDVAADIPRLAELRRVRLHERHTDEFRRRADEMRLADARRTEQQDVLLLVKRRGVSLKREPHMLEVIAQRDTENLLRLRLPDDEAVQVTRDVGGLEVEAELLGRRRALSDTVLGGRVMLGRARRTEFLRHTGGDRAEGIGMAGDF